ncbi:DNA topoisomerase IV subunit A [Klebsiella aerogenes]|nr:DNA topoisomerase IV subunit A [Klebsiella aerogenes]
MFPVSDLPQLSKGKGNKIISIPAAEAAAGQDGLAHLFVLPPQSTLTIHVGKRKDQTASGRAAKSHRRARPPRFADARAAEN